MIQGEIRINKSNTDPFFNSTIPFHSYNRNFEKKKIISSPVYFQIISSPNKGHLLSSYEENKTVTIFLGKLHYLESLAKKIGIAYTVLKNFSPAKIVLECYKKWGEDCPNHIEGNWVFIIWNAEKRRLFIVKEPYGDHAIYYYHHQEFFVFSTQIGDLIKHPKVPIAFNNNAILSMGSHLPKDEQTFFRDIKILPSAHSLVFQGNDLKIKNYWLPQKSKTIFYPKEEDYIFNFLDVFEKAIETRISHQSNGIALSSGFDSTSILALLAPLMSQLGKGLKAITWYTDQLSEEVNDKNRLLNEVPLARDFVDSFPDGVEFETIRGNDNLIDTLEFNLNIYNQPTYTNVHLIEIIRAAQQSGVQNLFTGAIGNFTISYEGNKNQYFKTIATSLNLKRLLTEMQNWNKENKSWLKTIYHTLYQPLFQQHFSFKKKKNLHDRVGSILNQEALNDNIPHFFSITQPKLVEALEKNEYPIKPYLKNFQHNNNIRHQPLYDYYDINVVEPAIDKRLAEFCFNLPNDIYVRNGQVKFLLKEAMKDKLPPQILHNKRRGKQAANLHYKFRKEYKEIKDLLESFRKVEISNYWLNVDFLLTLLDNVKTMNYKDTMKKTWSVFFLQNGLRLGLFLTKFDKK